MNIELQVKTLYANADKLDEAGFVADFYYIAKEYARQQLLQQTQCTTLRESLEQMLKDAKKQCVETKGMLDSVWHTANVKKIENVIKLIDEYPPVA